MVNLVVIIQDQPRGESVRLRVDADRRVDALTEWYVAHFGLPRRYFDLRPIEYRLVRAVDQRPLPAQETLRDAGIARGETLQLSSRRGRQVWRTSHALLNQVEQEFRDLLAEEAWERAIKKLAQVEATQTGGQRVQQVRRLVDEAGGPAKVVDVGVKFTEALGLFGAASTWAKHAYSALALAGAAVLIVGSLVVCSGTRALAETRDRVTVTAALTQNAPSTVTAAPSATPLPTATATTTPLPTATPTATGTATPVPTSTPKSTATETPIPTATPTITLTPTPVCIPQRPRGWVAYVVRRGDTLSRLARASGTTVAWIQRVNCLSGTAIRWGDRLWLPPIYRPATPTWTPIPPTVTATWTPVTPTVTPTWTPTPQPADLVVQRLGGLEVSCPKGGGTCVTQISFAVVNVGLGDASGFNIRIVADPRQSVVVGRQVTGLASRAAQGFTVTTPPGGNCYDPDCTVCVAVDSGNDVSESNEGNNELCTTRGG